MTSTTLRTAVILSSLLSVFLFPLEALGQEQPGKLAPLAEEAGLAPGCSKVLAARNSFPISNSDMLHLGVLGNWSSPRVNMTCQYGVFCPSTYCTSLRPQCNPGKYTETFMGKCCASPDSSYARFVCVNNGQTVIDQFCRY